MHLDQSSIDAGLGYCRWLHSSHTNEVLHRMAPAIPKRCAGVLVSDRGKQVYQAVAKQLADQRTGSSVLLRDGEIRAVQKFLLDLKDRKPTTAPRSGVKHATLQLSSITKFMGGGKRTIRGLANSGLIDRVGDIVEPKGGRWTLPVPLLWQHKHDQPIGWVRAIDARSDGLWITAELAEGIGKSDEAWKMIEAGLVDSYSIGFQADDWTPLPGGGKRFTSWSLHEVSVVTIPADPVAKIRRGAPSGHGAGIRLLGSTRAVEHPGSVRIVRSARR